MVDLSNWHLVLHELGITTQHFKWCINFNKLKLSIFLQETSTLNALTLTF